MIRGRSGTGQHSCPLTKNSVDAILSGARQILCTDMLVLVRVGLQSGARDWARGRGEGRAGPERKLQCGEVSSAVSQELDTTLRTLSAQDNKTRKEVHHATGTCRIEKKEGN